MKSHYGMVNGGGGGGGVGVLHLCAFYFVTPAS